MECRKWLGNNCLSLHNSQITGMQTCNSTGTQLAYGVFQRQNRNLDKSEVHLEKEERGEGESGETESGEGQWKREEEGREGGKEEGGKEEEKKVEEKAFLF